MIQHSEIHIAIAESQCLVRHGIIELIRSLDPKFHVCFDAGTGKELIEKINANYQPDVCLIDLQLDGMAGYETMQRISESYRCIKGLALSTFEDEYPVLRMYQNGAKGFLSKNASSNELKTAITEIFNNGYYFSKYVLHKFPKISETNRVHNILSQICFAYINVINLLCLTKRINEFLYDERKRIFGNVPARIWCSLRT